MLFSEHSRFHIENHVHCTGRFSVHFSEVACTNCIDVNLVLHDFYENILATDIEN